MIWVNSQGVEAWATVFGCLVLAVETGAIIWQARVMVRQTRAIHEQAAASTAQAESSEQQVRQMHAQWEAERDILAYVDATAEPRVGVAAVLGDGGRVATDIRLHLLNFGRQAFYLKEMHLGPKPLAVGQVIATGGSYSRYLVDDLVHLMPESLLAPQCEVALDFVIVGAQNVIHLERRRLKVVLTRQGGVGAGVYSATCEVLAMNDGAAPRAAGAGA